MFEYFKRQFDSKEEQEKEKKALELVQQIEEIIKGMVEQGETIQDYRRNRRISALLQEIKKIFEEKIIGWQLEGKLTEENVLAEYKAGGVVRAANFSPEGDKVVIGSYDDRMMRVISLTEKDEQGKPKVLAEYKAGGDGLGS
jgi:hypothetical protein